MVVEVFEGLLSVNLFMVFLFRVFGELFVVEVRFSGIVLFVVFGFVEKCGRFFYSWS